MFSYVKGEFADQERCGSSKKLRIGKFVIKQTAHSVSNTMSFNDHESHKQKLIGQRVG